MINLYGGAKKTKQSQGSLMGRFGARLLSPGLIPVVVVMSPSLKGAGGMELRNPDLRGDSD